MSGEPIRFSRFKEGSLDGDRSARGNRDDRHVMKTPHASMIIKDSNYGTYLALRDIAHVESVYIRLLN